LYFVSVSVGGWSGSAINMLASRDGGESWSAPRRLITSPFLNVSTLVKGEPLLHSDGSIALPVYHEFAGKFGELLRLSPEGRVLYKQRLSSGRYSLQPVVVPGSRNAAVGFMRYAGAPPRRMLAMRSSDGGRSWTVPEKTAMANPDAAIAAMRLAGGGLLLAFNDSESGRHNLSLAHSPDDGRSWRVVHVVEGADVGSNAEFSYPWLLRSADGDGHLFYTAGKQRIRHVRFNLAWLEQKLQ
jgi:predicted neuraminidase